MLKEKLTETEELSPLQKEYREFFQEMLDKFNVKSPAELTNEQKIDFFNAIAYYWENGKGPKEDPKDIKIKESQDINTFIKSLKESKLEEISETPVGQRGRTSRREAAEYIADHPEIIKEIEKMVKKVGGKEVLKQIVKIVLDVEIDHYTFQTNELEHMRMKKIQNLMGKYGKFIR